MMYGGGMLLSLLQRCVAVISIAALYLSFFPQWAHAQARKDIPADALLLYVSTETDGGAGFEKVVDYYGLTLQKTDLTTTTFDDTLLKDSTGAYYLAVYIDAAQLDQALSTQAVQALSNAIAEHGLNLYVGGLRAQSSAAMTALTDGEVTGSAAINASSKKYHVTNAVPEITRQLTGVDIRHNSKSDDQRLLIRQGSTRTQVLATVSDDGGTQWPLFARYQAGKGSVFVVANGDKSPYLRTNLLSENYYVKRSDAAFSQQWFAQVTPLLMFVRYAGGERVWHTDHNYANFTIDDPPLQQSVFDYAGFLQQTLTHHFHFTLAAVPGTIEKRDAAVLDLFRTHPEQFSLVQHGDTHEGYEFYRHEISPTDPYSMYVSSLATQETHLLEGRSALQAFSKETNIPFGPIMVFPFGISPSDTLGLLKKYNYQATINSSDVPLDAPRAREWDAYMYPAELAYNNFAVLLRYGTGQSPYPFLSFLGKPVLEYDHIERFAKSIEAYNPYADAINSLQWGKVEWRSLDYILKHLYFQKTNRDGSVDVKFWGNHVIVTNESTQERTYHIQRDEAFNVPILNVRLDGAVVNYLTQDAHLQVESTIPAGGSRDVLITYDESTADAAAEDTNAAGKSRAAFKFLPPLCR